METLHTKHRPVKFDKVVGQDLTVASVRKVLKAKSSRAFIFYGPTGTGKTTLARIVAIQVGCEGYNLIEIDAATHSSVDAMRLITETIQYRAMGKSASRVLIVDEAHALSKAAWQSLLKSVEEPPEDTYWIFCTTDAHRIPETIRNRCAQYEMKAVDADDLMDKIIVPIAEKEKIKLDEDSLYLIACSSDNSPRKAITFLTKCASCKDKKAVADMLRTMDGTDNDAIELCRLLIKGCSWTKAAKMLDKLKHQNPESIRMLIISYFSKVAMSSDNDSSAAAALAVMDAFRDPMYSFPQIVLAVGELVLGSDD